MPISKTSMTAATGSLALTPATFAAAWTAFGIVAPEVVLPLTALAMACTAVGTYFATEALTTDVHSSLIGEDAQHLSLVSDADDHSA